MIHDLIFYSMLGLCLAYLILHLISIIEHMFLQRITKFSLFIHQDGVIFGIVVCLYLVAESIQRMFYWVAVAHLAVLVFYVLWPCWFCSNEHS